MSSMKLALVATLLAVVCTFAHADDASKYIDEELQGQLFQSVLSDQHGVATQQRSLLSRELKGAVYSSPKASPKVPKPSPTCFNKNTLNSNTYFIQVASRLSWGAVRDALRKDILGIYTSYAGTAGLSPMINGPPGQLRKRGANAVNYWEITVVIPVPACSKDKEAARNKLRNLVKKDFQHQPDILKTRLRWYY